MVSCKDRICSIDYFRTTIILLILVNHALTAYASVLLAKSVSFTQTPHIWALVPIRDSTFLPFDIFVNTMFYVAITPLFFISGLFVWESLKRKNAQKFLADRFIRIGIPFCIGSLLLAPLSFYPVYLLLSPGGDVISYIQTLLSFETWHSGVAWFLWILFVFSALAATLFLYARRLVEKMAQEITALYTKPILFFVFLCSASFVCYYPLYAVFHHNWYELGPFALEANKILVYALFFFVGMLLGVQGLQNSHVTKEGAVTKRWPVWVLITLSVLGIKFATQGLYPFESDVAQSLFFVIAVVSFHLSLLALFLTFCKKRNKIMAYLGRHAFLMYLLQQPIYVWLQYSFLSVSLPVYIKGALVVLLSLGIGLVIAIGVKKIPVLGTKVF